MKIVHVEYTWRYLIPFNSQKVIPQCLFRISPTQNEVPNNQSTTSTLKLSETSSSFPFYVANPKVLLFHNHLWTKLILFLSTLIHVLFLFQNNNFYILPSNQFQIIIMLFIPIFYFNFCLILNFKPTFPFTILNSYNQDETLKINFNRDQNKRILITY